MDVPRIFEVQYLRYDQCLVFIVLLRIELNPPSNNIMKRAIYKTYNQIPSYTVVHTIDNYPFHIDECLRAALSQLCRSNRLTSPADLQFHE